VYPAGKERLGVLWEFAYVTDVVTFIADKNQLSKKSKKKKLLEDYYSIYRHSTGIKLKKKCQLILHRPRF